MHSELSSIFVVSLVIFLIGGIVTLLILKIIERVMNRMGDE